jgi:molecular chaperone HscB
MAQPSLCWQCQQPAGEGLFCKSCNSLQPPRRDYFEFFGLEKTLSLDTAELQRRFYELSRKLHPDRYQRKPAVERDYSLEATAILNDGYRTLRDPVRRAEYMLAEAGFVAAEQRAKDVPPELLEEVFELNMALEEIRSGDDSARPQLIEERGKFAGMLGDSDKQLDGLFANWDSGRKRETLAEIRGVLNRRKYIENLLKEVDKALDVAQASSLPRPDSSERLH